MPNLLLSRNPIRRLTLSVLTAIAVSGCAANGKRVSPASSSAGSLPAPYMRVVRSDSGPLQLQIALREFLPARRSGPSIWLVAVSHIGESSYYAAVQQHLDAQALVLFEGVGERHARSLSGPPATPSTNRNHLAKTETDDSAQTSLQSTLAGSLGLAFQLDAIDYNRPHFHNSDLTLRQIQALLDENATDDDSLASAPGESDGQLSQLVGLMDGSSLLGVIVHAAVKLIGSSPKLQALTKIAVIELFGNLQGDISQSSALPPDMKKLVDVLIQGRNRVVVDDLKEELRKLRKRQAVAVFYGAGHMHDLETRVRNELNYRPVGDRWLTAISVDPGEAGVTDAELRLVQSVVKWQLEALHPKSSPVQK